jgi:alpha-tubulin suppressor-like RCC1 family protein
MIKEFHRTLALIALVAALVTTGFASPVSAAPLSDEEQPTATAPADETVTAVPTEVEVTPTPTVEDPAGQDPTAQDPTVEPTDDGAGLSGEGVLPSSAGSHIYLPIVLKPWYNPALLNAVKVQVGNGFACALMSNSSIECWGRNDSGQLGNGSQTNSSVPGYVSSLSGIVKDFTVGYDFACALTNDNRVMCWGENSMGQLGNGGGGDETKPIQVTGFNGAVQSITAGGYHACALTADSYVFCWGSNTVGQLGNYDNGKVRVRPVSVYNIGPSSHIISIAAGGYHTCAVQHKDDNKNEVYCWGYNNAGQLGDTTTTNRNIPTKVNNLSNVSQISAGDLHTCVRTNGGSVRCWGYNYYGQLGNDSTNNASSPVKVSGMSSGEQSVSNGFDFSCSVTDWSGVKCWGNNTYGQLGNNTKNISHTPVDVYGLGSGVGSVSAEVDFACAVTLDGGVKCWGRNNYGQLGNQTTTDSAVPVTVNNLKQ